MESDNKLKLTVRPVTSVRCREEGASVERVLHDAAQVPDLGHNLRLAGAVVGVSLGQNRNPLAVGQKSEKSSFCFC